MVEEVEMSMKILGPSSPGFSLGLGRAIEKEKPQTHGNQVKSPVTPAPPAGVSPAAGMAKAIMYQRLNSPPVIKSWPSYPPHHIYSDLD